MFDVAAKLPFSMLPAAPPDAFQLALQLHQAGRLPEAEGLYRQILAGQANHAGALHYSGLIALQTGHPDSAADLISRSLTVDPTNAGAHSNLGECFRALGRWDDAVACQRRALVIQPGFLQAHYNLGFTLAQRGQMEAAIASYRNAVALKPDFIQAHNNLGNALRAIGRPQEAVSAFQRALEIQPEEVELLNNLGNALKDTGSLNDALAAYHRAVLIKPDFAQAWFNLGVTLDKLGRTEDAVPAWQQAIKFLPDHPESHRNLGAALAVLNQLPEAVAVYHRALELRLDDPDVHNELGNALLCMGRRDEAVAEFRRALGLKADFVEAHNNLGNALRGLGQLEQAVAAYHRALDIDPNMAMTHYNLGCVLRDEGKLEEAVASYRRALELDPSHVDAHNNLGNAYKDLGRLDEAFSAFQQAQQLDPGYPQACNNLANALRDQGLIDEALAAYRRSLQLWPGDARVQSNLIYTLHYHPGEIEPLLAEELAKWNRQFAAPLKLQSRRRPHDRNPDRRLRIGYVSPDFRDHVAGRYVWPLFRCHDDANFEIVCYSGVIKPDETTASLRAHADRWHNVTTLSDESLAELIRQDGIDILVDLSQHMAGNRLPVFARQPAPVQVSFAGYPESTGLDAIGYRISGRWLEGECRMQDAGLKLQDRRERDSHPAPGVFLIDTFWCYDPCGIDLAVNDLPAAAGDGVIFGCLNNFCKVNGTVLKVWAQVLAAVRNSRLVLLSASGSHRQRVVDLFQREGITSNRIEFVEMRPRREYLELYHRLDIALDPFPYGGHTTSLDALWMGVPIVTLAGRRAVSRAGLSQLSNLGLPELIAFSEDEYVAIASDLARDLPRLAELRGTLRARMEASPLMDAPAFARNIEAAYRAMWRESCADVER
jgi:predicted O-linked N-acetylglucosamine transferase (SPINDLY family)